MSVAKISVTAEYIFVFFTVKLLICIFGLIPIPFQENSPLKNYPPPIFFTVSLINLKMKVGGFNSTPSPPLVPLVVRYFFT